MRNKGIILIIACVIVLSWPSLSYSLKEETHQAINIYIGAKTKRGQVLKYYFSFRTFFYDTDEER